MPIYEYECDACHNRFELMQKFSDKPVKRCPKCGEPVHKVLSPPALVFKGTGWYVTDYASKDRKRAQKAEQPQAPRPGRERMRLHSAEGHDAEPVASACREVTDCDRGALRDVSFPPIRRPELHRGRGVEDEPGDEDALGQIDAHVRLGRARGDVPIDPPHVVTGDVRPDER